MGGLKEDSFPKIGKLSLNEQVFHYNWTKKKAAAYATANLIELSVKLLVLSCSSAIRTSNWFVFESLFLVEFLFTYCENEFVVAVSANDLLIFH